MDNVRIRITPENELILWGGPFEEQALQNDPQQWEEIACRLSKAGIQEIVLIEHGYGDHGIERVIEARGIRVSHIHAELVRSNPAAQTTAERPRGATLVRFVWITPSGLEESADSVSALRVAVDGGAITGETLVKSDALPRWLKASEHPDFAPILELTGAAGRSPPRRPVPAPAPSKTEEISRELLSSRATYTFSWKCLVGLVALNGLINAIVYPGGAMSIELSDARTISFALVILALVALMAATSSASAFLRTAGYARFDFPAWVANVSMLVPLLNLLVPWLFSPERTSCTSARLIAPSGVGAPPEGQTDTRMSNRCRGRDTRPARASPYAAKSLRAARRGRLCHFARPLGRTSVKAAA